LANNTILFGKTPLKAQNDYSHSKNVGGMAPLAPRGYAYVSRACGILFQLKHYATLPVLKVFYNSLIHPYLNYAILNWGRASNATIQPLIKLQNKAIKLKIINPTNTGSLEEHF